MNAPVRIIPVFLLQNGGWPVKRPQEDIRIITDALDWIDTTHLSFNNLLLMEREQIRWFPGWLPENELSIALHANPCVEWYPRNKCPEVASWLDRVMALSEPSGDPDAIYAAEQNVLRSIDELLFYAIVPSIYDALPFLGWDDTELTGLIEFAGKIVLDIGSGTGSGSIGRPWDEVN